VSKFTAKLLIVAGLAKICIACFSPVRLIEFSFPLRLFARPAVAASLPFADRQAFFLDVPQDDLDQPSLRFGVIISAVMRIPLFFGVSDDQDEPFLPDYSHPILRFSKRSKR
jgi:hypothetical protein